MNAQQRMDDFLSSVHYNDTGDWRATPETDLDPDEDDDTLATAQDALAMDRDTVRSRDQDGRLHVEITNISKAAVNPYRGSEIPDAEALGLDPDKIYQLLRDPEELVKAATTFNNLPLLDVHIPVTVDDPRQEHVIGSTGTDAVFEAPYLRNSLVVWTAEAIDGIESGEQQEISCAYRYVADMTPGEYEGERYDGVMREIRGNHVALVATGRAGPDVVVGDSVLKLNQEIVTMSKSSLSKKAVLVKGALLALLAPKKIAADAMPDLDKALVGVMHRNYLDKKPGIVAALKASKALATDEATISEVVNLLDRLDGEEPMDDNVATDGPAEAVLAMLRGKLSDEDLSAVEAKLAACMGGATDADEMEPDPDNPGQMRKKPVASDTPPPTEGSAGEPKDTDTVTVAAMDAALAEERRKSKLAMDAAVKKAAEDATKATLKLAQDIALAEEDVRPYVGRLALAFDSPDAVYKAALDTMSVDTKDVHPSAFKAILAAQPKPGSRRSEPVLAHDGAEGFAERFPTASRLINA
jgi:hypothetical protein